MSPSYPTAGDPVEAVTAVVNASEVAVVRAATSGQSVGSPAPVPVVVTAVSTPTQVRRPWRSTARTVWQAFLGLCVLAPILVATAGLDPAQLPWLASVLVVAGAVTRVMAVPGVEKWLRRFVPFLAAAPRPPA